MRSFALAKLLPLLALAGCVENETNQGLTVPLEFQGRWGLNAEQCARSSDARGDWLFVDASSVGGFEHMYELAEVSLTGNDLYFITAGGGPAGHLKLVNATTLQVEYVGKSSFDLILCSKNLDL